MNQKIHYIYKITLLCGSLSGKYYYGKHTTSNQKDGYTGSGRIVKDYYKKYGRKKNVTYIKEIVEYNSTMEINAEREKIIIGDLWKTDPDCLNCCEGGVSGVSCIPVWNKGLKGCFSEETIKKMSDAKKGKTPWMKGKKHTEESLMKMREAQKNKVISQETREKLSKAGIGRVVSEKTREKLRKAHTGKKMSAEAKIKMMTPIAQYTLDGEYVRDWNGATEVENTIGISHKQIWKCLKGYRKQVDGYVWKYKKAV